MVGGVLWRVRRTGERQGNGQGVFLHHTLELLRIQFWEDITRRKKFSLGHLPNSLKLPLPLPPFQGAGFPDKCSSSRKETYCSFDHQDILSGISILPFQLKDPF